MHSFVPDAPTEELCRFAYFADREARADLSAGFIRDEDDYTSHLTGALRRNINAHSSLGLSATSYVLPQTLERRTGCDAAIIVTHNGLSKVALFEAKWPRLASSFYAWDYAQTATGLSHYSDQLARQERVRAEFAVFEIFYCEFPFGKQPHYMHPALSSCVWRDNAVTYNSSRTDPGATWSRADLTSMLSAQPVTSIVDILTALCECTQGTPIPAFGDLRTFAGEMGIEGDVLEIRVPDTLTSQ